ncbi:MAG: hypothetical protein AAF828_11580 [Bacteroidota bacterium]
MPKKIAWLPVVLGGLLSVFLLFPSWWSHLNTKVVEGYGDGYKAYHAILYHAKYDSSYHWYEGMNYPYGEHIVPGASQPLLSNGMRILEDLGIPAADYGWAIVHLSMLLGIVLGMLFTFLLLQRMGVRWWLATFGALAVGLMAPQLDRIIAHYGLAHSEVLPAVLYYLKRWDEEPNWKPALAVALCVWLFSQIHFYYFAILAFTIGGFLAARWLLARDWKRWWYYGWTLFLMFGLPAIYFFGWFALTDPVDDRNEAPWGFFNFHSELMSILSSHTQPHWSWLQEKLGYPYSGFEGWAYIGLPAVVLILVLVGRAVVNKFQRPFVNTEKDHQLYLHSLLLSSFGILLFSFGLPLTAIGGEDWLEYFGPLRQFRSVGRFAWLFYYVINLVLYVELEKALQKSSERRIWLLPLLLTMVFAPAEVRNFWQAKDFRLDEVQGLHSSPTLAEETGLNFADYQAIIPVPYYNIGSDNFWWEQSGFVGQKVQTLSWQTGLSTNAAMLTRTSLGQTFKQLQFITEPYRRVQLLDDLPSPKPFLVAFDPERYDEFGDHSNHLVRDGKMVYAADGLELYELPLNSWDARLKKRRASVQRAIDTTTCLLDSLLLRDSSFLIYDDFSTGPRLQSSQVPIPAAKLGTGYVGTGYVGELSEQNRVLDIPENLDLPAGDYVLAFWMDIGHDRFARTTFDLRTWLYTGQEGPRTRHAVQEKVRIFDTNGWAMVEIPLSFSEPIAGMLLTLQMPLLKGQDLRVDDVLLRPAATEVYQRYGDTLYHNNRYYLPE